MLFLWRYTIILRRLCYLTFFFIALHFQQVHCACCLRPSFDVIINYLGGGVSITINKADITKQFTVDQAAQISLNDNKNILVGTFIVTVTSGTLEAFCVRAFTTPSYVYDINQFQALSNQSNQNDCKLALFGNKTATGVLQETKLFNNDIIIIHPLASTIREIEVFIDTYMLPEQIASLANSTCEMPMFFKIEGL